MKQRSIFIMKRRNLQNFCCHNNKIVNIITNPASYEHIENKHFFHKGD